MLLSADFKAKQANPTVARQGTLRVINPSSFLSTAEVSGSVSRRVVETRSCAAGTMIFLFDDVLSSRTHITTQYYQTTNDWDGQQATLQQRNHSLRRPPDALNARDAVTIPSCTCWICCSEIDENVVLRDLACIASCIKTIGASLQIHCRAAATVISASSS